MPFAEGMTGLVYARARWYDPATGSFLSPDSVGYADSANLYSFAGGDPVNRRDPTGEDAYDDKLNAYIAWWSGQMGQMQARRTALGPLYDKQVRDPNLRKYSFDTLMEMELMDAYLAVSLPGRVPAAADFFELYRGDPSILSLSFEQLQHRISTELEEGRQRVMTAAGVFMIARGFGAAQRALRPHTVERSAENVPRVVAKNQRASSYPRGRRVGSRREGRRPGDPLPGYQEKGAFEWTPDNIRRMEQGKPPLTPTGEPVELHHRGQNPAGPLDELTPATHDRVPHPVRPSAVDRDRFSGERRRYWIERVREFHGQ